MPADPDRRVRLLHREGFAADIGIAVEATVEAGGRLRPELLEDRDPLVGHRAARLEGGAVQRLEFLLQPAGADAQRHAAAGQDIQRGDHFRGQHRIAVWQNQYGSDQPQPLRRTGHHAKNREGLQRIADARVLAVHCVGVSRPALDREDDVVGDHRRVQAQPLALARQRENAVARGGRAASGEIEAIAHPGGAFYSRRKAFMSGVVQKSEQTGT
jgi:hypothetical protein